MTRQDTKTVPAPTVRRRKVFYIPGFDPMPPRRYRELYRTQCQAQAEISGYEIKQGQKKGAPMAWQAKTRVDGHVALADFKVLLWSDIVQATLRQGIYSTYKLLFQTAFIYFWSGTLRRLMWLRKGPVIAALYPVLMLLVQLLAAVFLAVSTAGFLMIGLYWMGEMAAPIASASLSGGQFWPILANAIVGIAAVATAWGVLRFFRRRDGVLYAYYLMHDYGFSARHWGRYPDLLEARMRNFADEIALALIEDWDEVLVVGHSSGAYIAVSVIADLVRDGRAPAGGPALALLTLGQVIPMVSFLPRADRLRADLNYLATSDALTWVDVSAPGDGCSFALCDPVGVSGVAPVEGQKWPLVLSAAFSQSLQPETWEALRRRFFRLHFQYLCAFDRPRGYDYFLITAGGLTLADRFAGRKPSISRIDVAASRYTSMAA